MASRCYLTDAIFPFYIIHQTTIEVAGHYLAKERLPLGFEAAMVVGATLASCFVTYEVARRIGPLRSLFGLKPGPRSQSRALEVRWQSSGRNATSADDTA